VSAAAPPQGAAVLYSRPRCSLCFVLERAAARAARRQGISLRVIDIETDPALRSRYDLAVPVLVLPGGEEIHGRATGSEVEEAFRRARRSIAAEAPAHEPRTGAWAALRRIFVSAARRSRGAP